MTRKIEKQAEQWPERVAAGGIDLDTMLAKLTSIYRDGLAAAQVIGDEPVKVVDTPERVEAKQRFDRAQKDFANHLEVHAVKAAVAATGSINPPPDVIKEQKRAIYEAFQAGMRKQ